MVGENNRLRDALGVTAWHEAGYDGTGVVAASGERWDGDSSTHGWKTAHTFLEVAPNAELISLPWEGVVNDAFGLEVTAGVKTHGVSVFWASIASAFTLPAAAEARFAAVKDRCVLMIAGGNKNSQTEGARVIESPSLWGVNACMCMADGRINPAYYNFDSKHIDFCAPDGWTLTSGARFTGTSAAAPALAGVAALVQQMAFEQIGRALSANEMHAFFADCARPVGSALQCGLGCPVLPPPGTVNLNKFVKKEVNKNDGSSSSNNSFHSGNAASVPDPSPQIVKGGYSDSLIAGRTLNIIERKFVWAHDLTARPTTDGIVLHHAAGNGDVDAVHASHLGVGWAGIGYHYYVCKDGRVYRGRPEWSVGAGVEGENSHLLHVCFEGNYESENEMPLPQFIAGRLLMLDLMKRFNLPVYRHNEWSNTACPGKHFPFDSLTKKEGAAKIMNGSEIYQTQSAYVNGLEESRWSQMEGGFAKATRQGVMDGTRPQAPVTREQLAAILLRLGLLD